MLKIALAALLILFAPDVSAKPAPPPEQTKNKQSTVSSGKPQDLQQFKKKVDEVEKTIAREKAKGEALEREAQKLQAEIQKLQQEMVEAASRTQEQEGAISSLENNLNDLDEKERAAIKDLLREEKTLAGLLAAMQRLSRQPPQMMMLLPQPPLQTIHGLILLRHTLPKLDASAASIKQELDAIAELQRSIGSKKAELEKRTKRLAQERNKLDSLVKKRIAAQQKTQQEQTQLDGKIRKMADEAADLRDLLEKLQAERKARELAAKKAAQKTAKKPVKPLNRADIKGLPLPARGKILAAFGEKSEIGLPSKGILIETLPGAQVTTPYRGEVVYAGQFRSYGRILIVEYGEGYHIMLSNLGRIDAQPGQEVVAGEPVGVMEKSTSAPPRLYVEYRARGQSVNPKDWVAALQNLVN